MQNTNLNAAAAFGMKAAAAPTLSFGPEYTPERFRAVLESARAELDAAPYYGDARNGREFSAQLFEACKVEFPNAAFPVRDYLHKYSDLPAVYPVLFSSISLFNAGQTAGPLDYFKFRNFIAAARAAVNRGMLTKDEFSAREFWFRESDSGVRFFGFGKFHRSEIPGIVDETFTRKSDAAYCPVTNQYWNDCSFENVKSFCDPDGNPGNGAVFNYQIYDRALSLFAFPLFYVGHYGAYIPEPELSLFNVVRLEDSGDLVHETQAHQHPNGLWYSRPFGIVCDPADAVSSYHSGAGSNPAPVRFSRNSPILTGWEIEKEDYQVKCSISHRDFSRALPNFRKERDGSLDDRAGFEFITPPLELSPRNIQRLFESNPVALSHINAAYSRKCGGHVHISRPGLSGVQLFDTIAGYLPLFYALFPSRADGSNSYYCRAKSARDLISDREKYQAVNILRDRIEIRIFGAVKGLENLVWRAALLKKIFERPTDSVSEMYFQHLPGLLCHLKKVYSTPEQLEKFIRRVEKYALKFEGESLNPVCDKTLLQFRPYSGRAVLRAQKKQAAFNS